jgi:hypothetical protein
VGVEPVVVDHALPWAEIIELPRLLEREWMRPESPIRALPPPVKPERFTWRWRLDPRFSSASEQLFDYGQVRFDSPSGLDGTALRGSVLLSPLATWGSFLRDEVVQVAVVRTAERVAYLVGGTTILYLPDNGYPCSDAVGALREGQSIGEVVSWLGRECGPPAQAISQIYVSSGDTWDGNGYFVQGIA